MRSQYDRTVSAGATKSTRPRRARLGAVAVEYVLLVTVVGIGALVGLASVRDALVSELEDLAMAIMAIT